MRARLLAAPVVVCALAGCSDKTFGRSFDAGAYTPIDSFFDAGSHGGPDAADAGIDAGTGVEGNGNNTGTVDGDVLAGTESNASLSKAVLVDVVGSSASFVVGPAYVTRDATGLASVRSIVQVRNDGAVTRCFVSASPLRLLDADKRVLASESQEFVTGSIRAGISTPGCLGPGESGYFLGIHTAAFDSVARVSLGIDPGEVRTEVPQARLVAEGVETKVDSFATKINVTFRNTGTHAATIEAFYGQIVLFDGTPVGWESLDVCSGGNLTVLPGEGATLCAMPRTNAHVTRVQAWCSFQDAP